MNAAEFTNLLSSTELSNECVAEIPILDTGETALAIESSAARSEQDWQVARALVDQSGRWPVVTSLHDQRPSSGGFLASLKSRFGKGHEPGLAERIQKEDFFSRFYFEEGSNGADVDPRAILRRADEIPSTEAIERMATSSCSDWDFDESVEYQLYDLNQRHGTAPDLAAVPQADIGDEDDLARWALDWEVKQPTDGNPEHARASWFENDPTVLLLLPIDNGWDALAYLSLFDANPAEDYVAVGRQWGIDFGAELFAHFGTILQCFVHQPPRDPHRALKLARQHELFAQSTLAGVGTTRSHYALGLIDHDRWFLHQRP